MSDEATTGRAAAGERMPCHEVIEQLWAYIDGELTQERTEQIRTHLEICARCYPHFDFEHAFVAFLRRHRDEAVPARLRRQLFERLLEEERRDDPA